jgi:predicted nucleic acid-binding protein
VLDSSVLVEMLDGSETGRMVSARLEEGKVSAYTSYVNIAEAGYILCRKIGHERALTAVKALLDSRVVEVEEDTEIHILAARLKCERAISLADCYTFAVSELTENRPLFLAREKELELEMQRKPFRHEPIFLK